jgi:hypothetical protein
MKSTRTEMPKIESNITCPYKNHPRSYAKKRSPWHEWLQALKPGDSFLIKECECQNVTHIARQMQIVTVLRHGPNETARVPEGEVRVWRAPEPLPGLLPKRRPYHRKGKTTPKLTEKPKRPYHRKLVQMPGPALPTTAPSEEMSLL